MIALIDFLLWVNLIVFLVYCVAVSYLDVKYREVDPTAWVGLVLINGSINTYMYLTDYWYPWYSLLLSGIMVVIFYVAFRYRVIEGADYLFLCFISMFWIMTPIGGAHGLMQPIFYIYLMFTLFMTAIAVMGYNVIHGNRFGIVEMMSKYPRGVPMMVPISVAFVLSVVMG